MSEFDHLTNEARIQKALLAAESANQGSVPFSRVNFSGAPVDEETLTIGEDVYQFVRLNQDTAANLDGALTASDIVVELTGNPTDEIEPGHLIRVGSEYMLALPGSTSTSINVRRGVFGTSASAHADDADVFQAANVPDAGVLAVPITTLSASQAEIRLAAALDYWQDGHVFDAASGAGRLRASVKLTAHRDGAANGVYLVFDHGVEPDVAETFTNGTATDVAPGQQGDEINESAIAVTLGSAADSPMRFAFPFDVRFAKAELYVSSVLDSNQPTVAVSGRVVTVTEGSTAFADGHVVRVTAG